MKKKIALNLSTMQWDVNRFTMYISNHFQKFNKPKRMRREKYRHLSNKSTWRNCLNWFMPIHFGSLQLLQLNGLFFSKNKKKRKKIAYEFLEREMERKGKNETKDKNQRKKKWTKHARELNPWRWKITISVVFKKMLVQDIIEISYNRR